MSALAFDKLSGAGNDFIVADDRRGVVRGPARAARRLCDRKFSVGADGLILLQRSTRADVRMRIFNSDGSEAEMCGNGVRCLAKFAADRHITKPTLTIETKAGLIHAVVRGDIVRARLSEPGPMKLDFTVRVLGRDRKLNFVNTGVPHVVKFVSDLSREDVEAEGRAIRRHARFAPRGTNVNFVQVVGDGLRVGTYERGVEGETLACGTGSTASALVAARLKGLRSPVRVRTKGGETLTIYFKNTHGRFSDVWLEGRIRKNFEGRVSL